jgi:hypothetical protein
MSPASLIASLPTFVPNSWPKSHARWRRRNNQPAHPRLTLLFPRL